MKSFIEVVFYYFFFVDCRMLSRDITFYPHHWLHFLAWLSIERSYQYQTGTGTQLVLILPLDPTRLKLVWTRSRTKYRYSPLLPHYTVLSARCWTFFVLALKISTRTKFSSLNLYYKHNDFNLILYKQTQQLTVNCDSIVFAQFIFEMSDWQL